MKRESSSPTSPPCESCSAGDHARCRPWSAGGDLECDCAARDHFAPELAPVLAFVEESVKQRAPHVRLDIAFSPVCPLPRRLDVAEVEYLGAFKYRVQHPEVPGPVTDWELRHMLARFITVRLRAGARWDELVPSVRADLAGYFHGGEPGFEFRLLPKSVDHVSFPREGNVLVGPACGDKEDCGEFPASLAKMTRFVGRHAGGRCKSGEPSPVPEDLALTVVTDAPALVQPEDAASAPSANGAWSIYTWNGRSARGDQLRFRGSEPEARAAWAKLQRKPPASARLLDGANTVIDRLPEGAGA